MTEELPPGRPVLMVCGSRKLALDAAAEAWGKALIRERLRGCCGIISGGAAGPDTWAREVCLEAGKVLVEYLPTGERVTTRPGDPDEPPVVVRCMLAEWGPNEYDPLKRNRAMLYKLLQMQNKGYPSTVLALLDRTTPLSRGGTNYTVRKAIEAGLDIERRLYPSTSLRSV